MSLQGGLCPRGRGLQSPLCAQGCVVDPPVEGSCSQAHLDPHSFVHNKPASSLHLSAFSFPLLFASNLRRGRRERCPSTYETVAVDFFMFHLRSQGVSRGERTLTHTRPRRTIAPEDGVGRVEGPQGKVSRPSHARPFPIHNAQEACSALARPSQCPSRKGGLCPVWGRGSVLSRNPTAQCGLAFGPGETCRPRFPSLVCPQGP